MSRMRRSQKCRARQQRRIKNRALHLEGLENRELMAANLTASLSTADRVLRWLARKQT